MNVRCGFKVYIYIYWFIVVVLFFFFFVRVDTSWLSGMMRYGHAGCFTKNDYLIWEMAWRPEGCLGVI